jgi:Family of unknown function (DUF6480)
MSAIPPDPDPINTPSIERGGGVEPGETPPASAQTSASPHADPPAPRKYTFGVVVSLVAIAVFLTLFVAAAVLLLVKAVSGTG